MSIPLRSLRFLSVIAVKNYPFETAPFGLYESGLPNSHPLSSPSPTQKATAHFDFAQCKRSVSRLVQRWGISTHPPPDYLDLFLYFPIPPYLIPPIPTYRE